jgi:hypothetical protein
MMREPFQLRLFHCSAPLKESLARFSADRWLVHWHESDELTDVVPASVQCSLVSWREGEVFYLTNLFGM